MNDQNWFWILFEIIINLFQGFLIVYFLTHVLKKKYPSVIYDISCGVLFAFFCSLYIFFPMPEIDTWVFIVPLIYSLLCFQNTFWQKMFWNAIMIIIFLGIANITLFLAESLPGVSVALLFERTALRILFVLTNNLLLFISFFAISRIRNKHVDNILPLVLFTLLNLCSIFVIDSLFVVMAATDDYSFWLLFASVLALCISGLSFVLYIIMSRYSKQIYESKLKEQQLQMEAKRSDELHNLYASLSAMQHDLRHHLQIAAALAKDDNALQSSQYIQEIESDIFSIFSTGCPALDSALTIKELEMHRKGIKFKHELCFLSDLPVRVYEICSIVSNLLDNAIEAYKHFPEKTQEYVIELNMRLTRGMLYIKCTNPVNIAALNIKDEEFLTTKKGSGHGLGITGIKAVVDDALGNYSFTVENNTFVAFLAIPYMSKTEREKATSRGFISRFFHKKHSSCK